ncbi:MAG TPA: hypothetical protein VIY66_00200 [Candidatus Acidoferrales bacterium]
MRFTGRSRAVRAQTGLLLLAIACFGALRLSASPRQSAASAKEAAPDLKSFVGTWKANFKGSVFATLILKEEDSKLSGTLNNFDIVTDKDGNLIDGTHADDGNAPLLNVHFKAGALYFVVLEKDQYSSGMNWKFTPLNAQEGTLTPLLELQDNIPPNVVIKPIQMLRSHTKP